MSPPPSRPLRLRVNGRRVELLVPPHRTLLEVLRYELDLIGTKQGCDKGDCGACTVQLEGRPALSCLTLALTTEGRSVRTVEGMDSAELHPLLDAFEALGAAQCGFCTPGILMAAESAILEAGRPITEEEAAEAIAGNLCRCTGYTKILEAVATASRRMWPESERQKEAEGG